MEIVTYPDDECRDQIALIQKVIGSAGIDYRPSYVMLDGQDYSNDPALLDEFQKFAFYWNRSKPKEHAPLHVRAVMDDTHCHHLIWLSRRALIEEEILFAWILAHELRHFCQAVQGLSFDGLSRSASELRRLPKFRTLPPTRLTPAELDSDLFAMQIVRRLFGSEQLNAFFGRRPLFRSFLFSSG